MCNNYSSADLDIVTFRSLSPNSDRFLSVKNWILSMTEVEDAETGIDYWEWILNNDQIAKNNPDNIFNTFFVFLHGDRNSVVATASVVKDDQNMGERLKLNDASWIGGFNVHRNFRGRHIGKHLMEYIDQYISEMLKEERSIYLFTNNPKAKDMYIKYGYISKGLIENNQAGELNELFTKLYSKDKYICDNPRV